MDIVAFELLLRNINAFGAGDHKVNSVQLSLGNKRLVKVERNVSHYLVTLPLVSDRVSPGYNFRKRYKRNRGTLCAL